jgi:hypothetical protein
MPTHSITERFIIRNHRALDFLLEFDAWLAEMAAKRDRRARATPPHDCQRFFRGTLLAKPGNERKKRRA